MKLLENYQLNGITLQNRMVMAPMTRSRAIGNVPNDLMATYYAQRAGAGLIVTEGTSPSPNGLGYPRIPGIFNDQQVEGWKKVTTAVHEKGGKIFLQIMHTGRVSHPDNMPEGAQLLAPSAVPLSGQMYTDGKGLQDYPLAKAMDEKEIAEAIQEYVQAAKNAIEAGFDGVELHGANGYLIEQFINPITNKRTDQYGGNVTNRNRFAIEVAKAVVTAIGAGKTAIRISPYGAFNDMGSFEGIEEAYLDLVTELSKLNLAYLHLVDHSSMGAPEVPAAFKENLRKTFKGTFVLSGGYDKERALDDLASDRGDLVAFGRPFISNPNLPKKFAEDLELKQPDYDKFYTPGPDGYTDYATA